MKIWNGRKVTLIASTYPALINGPYDFEFSEDLPEESVVEFAGRLCYLSFGEGTVDGHKTIQGRTTSKEYIANILNVKHGSVIEHANYTILIEGVSRSLTHELVRHRHFSYSQLSQRYVDESEVGFVVPPELSSFDEAYRIWYDACDTSIVRYKLLMNELEKSLSNQDIPKTQLKKRIRQTARSVLPNCTETKIVVTGNARAWRHFLVLRGNMHADTEIRRLAIEVWNILKEESPNLFEDFKLEDGELKSEMGSI